MIKLDMLTKYYKNNARGIIDISLEIKPGEVFGFIGPNGAGKSTTVRTLLNLIFPTSGSASVMGLDIIKDTVEIKKNVGYVPSEVHYYSDMTVYEFLNYSTKYYTNNFDERLKYLSKRLELDLTRKISELSFGNKKKIAIVAAFIYEPKVLILDEPTSGLDPLIQAVFFQLLEEERKRGATIFFSSHILSDVQKICSRVGIIKEGRLVKVESIEDLLKNQAKNVRISSPDLILSNNGKIVNLRQVNNTYFFTYKGKINELLTMINKYTIEDLSITELSLEEIFMHYYSRGDEWWDYFIKLNLKEI